MKPFWTIVQVNENETIIKKYGMEDEENTYKILYSLIEKSYIESELRR